MRKEFNIKIVKLVKDGEAGDLKPQEKTYTVTDNIAARMIFEPRVGSASAIIQKHTSTRFLRMPITELACIAYGLIKGAGHDVTEEEIGQAFVDMGDIAALEQVLPIIEYWAEKMNDSLGVGTSKKKQGSTSTSTAKRTRSR